jgi:hypothetical protein
LFILVRIACGQLAGTVEHLIGRWMPRRAELLIGVAFLLVVAILCVQLDRCFGMA